MIEYDFEIKGSWAYGAPRLSKKRALRSGNEIKLRREPDNPYDSNAVEVYRKRSKLGYLPKELAALVADYLDKGGEYSGKVSSSRQTVRNGSKYPVIQAEVVFYNLSIKKSEFPAKGGSSGTTSASPDATPVRSTPPVPSFGRPAQTIPPKPTNWFRLNCPFCKAALEIGGVYVRVEVRCPACLRCFNVEP